MIVRLPRGIVLAGDKTRQEDATLALMKGEEYSAALRDCGRSNAAPQGSRRSGELRSQRDL
jgi:hypothetical protein